MQVTLGATGAIERAGIGADQRRADADQGVEAERFLQGKTPDAATIAEAARLAGKAASPSPDRRGSVEYKREMARVLTARALPPAVERAGRTVAMSKHNIRVTINGTAHEAEVESRLLLVHFLRDQLGLTGTHIGCDTTHCGACTVLLDGEPVKSCTVLAVQADGATIVTVEGLEQDGKLHPLQEGFWQEHGLQCGFCTPGMLMTGLRASQTHTDAQRSGDPPGDLRQSLPLHRLRQHRQVDPVRGRTAAMREEPMAPQTTAEVGGMGHSIKRKEDPRFIRGKGNYVDDIKLPGMLYLDIVRSPYAHATIKKIDTERRCKVPGVLAVITGETLAKYNLHWMPTLMSDTQMVLPTEKVMYQAQEVAARASPPSATPPPTASTRWRSTTSRCRSSSIRSRRSSQARRCCAPTRRTRRTITSSTGKSGDREATDAGVRERRRHRRSRTSTSRASTSPRSRPAAASPTSIESPASSPST